ncbi:hypothetical protein VTN77DRAFT_109 [Rasamsonia byssochlamydoides]|uniref:uncharacterized protein n=1 Tax=Rasamsonia byssochlamydoides TaxID=89139 RepID=UPI0037434A18
MADLSHLSDAHAILLASELCSAGNVAALPQLQRQFPTSLSSERLLRIILTFLPESTPPQRYTPVLQSLIYGSLPDSGPQDIDISLVKDLPEVVVRKRLRRLRLLPLRHPHAEEPTDSADLLTQFLIHRAYRIDAETGLQTLILDLLLPFYERSETLRTWLISRLLPLLRLNYEYYPSREELLSLDTLDSMDKGTAVNVLLSMTSSDGTNTDLARNLRGLVGPWMYGEARFKRRKLSHPGRRSSVVQNGLTGLTPDETELSGWGEVNEWLLSQSLVDFGRVVGAFASWRGPEDVDLGGYDNEEESSDEEKLRLRGLYGQTGLAVVYATADPSRRSLEGSFQITARVAELLQLENDVPLSIDDPSLPSLHLDVGAISSASKASLLQNALLTRSNALTTPTAQSVAFLRALLLSLRIFGEFGYPTSCRSVATLCLQSGDEAQMQELRGVVDTIIKQAKPGRDWARIREQILWLRDWHGSSERKERNSRREYHGLFWRVSRDVVETEVLKAMLTVGEYQLAVNIYTAVDGPLSPEQVEAAATETIITFYDNASNGNKTRGRMKKAVDILRALQPHFPNSKSLKEIEALIAATHALSFYSLTLQHGVPFQPVSIRVHPDPLSLIEKVLEQNPKSYTKLDDFLSIGRNLVAAGLPTSAREDTHLSDVIPPPSRDAASVITERRVIFMAVSSALSSNDFGTAYSYIFTRLTPPSLLPSSKSATSSSIEDDISWRAAYQAGRYRPSESASPNLQSQITNLSQRMELLSLALILAPSPDPLPEILGAWRRCDEEMTVLRSREAEESEEWDRRGDKVASLSTVPGGFGPTDKELDAFENEQRQARRARARSHHADEEAPMGLFEVARGAARAFSKNAFPLHASTLSLGGSSQDGSTRRTSEEGSRTDVAEHGESPTPGRMRKRDMVSNMVTGGLASGIGWVLGAQPVNMNNR